MNEAGLELAQVDFVAFYEKPILKFDRLIETYLAFAPYGFKSFRSAIPVWVKEKLFQERELKRGLGGHFNRRIVYPMHHNSTPPARSFRHRSRKQRS